MKNSLQKTLLSTAAMMLLTAGVAMAQSSNSTPPGPTMQKEPGMASNNLPNPGTPQPQAETATAPADQTPPADTTDTMGTTAPPTDTTTTPTPATTDTAVDTTGGTTLPATGSEMPLVGLAGLLALGAAGGLWASRR
jgi:LPXTG-motif cell wall-anchored protein